MMAKTYSPNPDRKIVNGRIQVSAEELADFKKKYGSDKTLRDLLNMDKGLSRRGSKPEASMREKFANQYKDPIRAFASAELGMGEGPGEMRKRAVPSKQRVTTPMKGTAFSEETPSITPSPAPSRRGISSDMPSSPSGGGMDEDRRTAAETPPMFANQRMAAAREKARSGSSGTDRRSVTERMGGEEESGSVTERMKRAREKARGESKTGTDTRSVSERIKSALGLKKGGNVKSYVKGGSVRGAGIAQRGVKACKTY
jgi:hypothetical protein